MINIENYKNKKLNEVDYFLRGLGLKNVKEENKKNSENVVVAETMELSKELGVEPTELTSIILEINKNVALRSIFEDTMRAIDSLRYELEDTNLFFMGPNTEQETDEVIDEFIQEIMKKINELKNNFLIKFYNHEKIRINDSFESDSLEFFKVQIGDKQFTWKKEKKNHQVESRTTARQEQKVDNLARVLSYIYLLPFIIKKSIELKNNMNNALHDLSKVFKPNGPTSKKISQTLGNIQKAKNAQEAIEIFSNLKALLNEMIEKIEKNYNTEYLQEMNANEYENLKNIMEVVNIRIPELQLDSTKHRK